jgi:hypothetical protein
MATILTRPLVRKIVTRPFAPNDRRVVATPLGRPPIHQPDPSLFTVTIGIIAATGALVWLLYQSYLAQIKAK